MYEFSERVLKNRVKQNQTIRLEILLQDNVFEPLRCSRRKSSKIETIFKNLFLLKIPKVFKKL